MDTDVPHSDLDQHHSLREHGCPAPLAMTERTEMPVTLRACSGLPMAGHIAAHLL